MRHLPRALLIPFLITMACGKKTADQTPPKPSAADTTKPATKPAPTIDAAVAAAPAPADAAPIAAATGDAGAAGGDLAAKHVLHDIKVLPKTWTWDQVHTYMEDKVAQGLGQKCSFCHTKGDFAASTENKETAREMITMVDGLNKKYFAGKPRVSCITCHNGHKSPGK